MPLSDDIKFDPFVIERLMDVLRTAFTSRFKEYYLGDPVAIPVSALPCMVIEKESSTVEHDATGFDRVTSRVIIKLIENKKVDFHNPGQRKSSHFHFHKLVEGRDPTTRQYLDQTVLGVIRKQFTLSDTLIDQSLEIEYGIGLRPDELMTSEATVTITLQELVEIGSRT